MVVHQKSTLLVVPNLQNYSCSHARYSQINFLTNIGVGDFLQMLIVLSLTLGILAANILLIVVINSRRYAKYIHSQPRYLLTSLASNDLAMGLLVTPFAIVPSLRHCWPYGDLVCQIQALLRGAISQQSAIILVCMAMDRYMCMLHPARYHKHSSKKGCVAIISMTWIMSVTLFSVLVLPRGGFYFNATGMLACEPFYKKSSIRILAACGFYFPTTMLLMYCYGSAFQVNKFGMVKRTPDFSAGIHQDYAGIDMEKLVSQERRLSTTASRTMAAMSLGFIVLVTPWTILEIVAACTGSKAPPTFDFLATWLALSNSFWNPFLYWLLNSNFRRITRELFYTRLLCRTPHPDLKPMAHQQHLQASSHCCSNSSSAAQFVHNPGCELSSDHLSEKYWGEILERTLSSTSLHATLRPPLFNSEHHRCCNGIGMQQEYNVNNEMNVLERESGCTGPDL